MNIVHQLLTEHIDIWTAADTGAKSGRGRSTGTGASVYGIAKLRALILELAVIGKLVPQDANDEPASVLLKQIKDEKAKLLADGKIKKDKPTPPIADDEKPCSLPSGWEWVRLSEITSIRGGSTPSMAKSEYWDGSIPWISPKDMHDGVIVDSELKVTEKAIKETNLELVPVGSILIVGRSGILKRKLPAQITAVSCTVNQDIKAVTPIKPLSDRYMQLIFWGNEREILVRDVKQGTTVQSLVYESLFSRPFRLPPAQEQHRIVAKVDELMALCDQLEAQHTNAVDAHEKLVSHLLGTLIQSQNAEDFSANWRRITTHFDTLFTTEASIDALKQTLLQLAVMGKLVPQNPNDEPASELLKRIQAEKAKSIADGKIKNGRSLLPIATNEKPFELAEGWQWVRFADVANTRLGKMLDNAKNRGTNRPYLRNTNVQWFDFEIDDLKEMRFEDHELDEYRVLAGDLIICEGGEPGRCAIWRGQVNEMYIQKALHRARTWSGVTPEFLQFCLKVDASTGYLNRFFTGVTIKHFSGEKLSEYVVPLPPTLEQNRIVAKVDELMTFCDQLKIRINEASQLQQRLADAVVEQAVARSMAKKPTLLSKKFPQMTA